MAKKIETTLWPQYRRAFSNAPVRTYALVKDGKFVGSVGFKYPRDGMGKLQAYVYTTGDEYGLQYGKASGCGYDKHTAAMRGMTICGFTIEDQSNSWDFQLRNAGIEVHSTLHG